MTAVTVAIPVFNGGRFLASTIASLLAQTHRDFRVVVIDDRSTDGSVDIARSFDDPRIEVIVNTERRGLAGNWNVGQSLATSEYLLIAHQDDLYEPEFLSQTSHLLDAHPKAFIAHSRAQYVDVAGRPLRPAASRFKDRFWPSDEPYEREPGAELTVLQRGNYIVCPAVLYRVKATVTIGGFNESLRFVPDWEYWVRGLIAGFSIVGTHQRLMRWRRHAATATHQEEATLRRYEEELELLQWLAHTSSLPQNTSAVENTLLSDFAAQLSRGNRKRAAALRRFATERLPRSTATHALMAFGMATGRGGGHALRVAEWMYTRLARPV